MDSRTEPDENKAYQLGIADLLAWIALTALYFTFKQWLMANSKLPSGWNIELSRVLFGVQSVVGGLQLASLFFCLRAVLLRRRFPIQPGHFLLLIGALATGVVILQALLCNFMLDVDKLERENWNLCFSIAMPEVCVAAATTLLAGIAQRKRIHWLLFFFVLAAHFLFLLFMMNRQYLASTDWISAEHLGKASYIAVRAYIYLSFASMLLAVACMAYDFYKGRRDFLHLGGVVAFATWMLARFASGYLN